LSRRESPFRLEVAGATHSGRRHANEDHFRYDDDVGLLAVASGQPNRPAPRTAADTAIDALFDYVMDPSYTTPAEPRERLERAFAHVHLRVREKAQADEALRGMATTLACVLDRGRILLVGHVGDSRVARIRERHLERLTTVHRPGTDRLGGGVVRPGGTHGNERDTLTRGIGLAETIAPEVCVEGLRVNDAILICTATLMDVLDDRTIMDAVQRCRQPAAIVQELIQCALAEGVSDSLTLVYGHWREPGQ
jgi:PPM family protein phosphatase